jgi:hypothetical protein
VHVGTLLTKIKDAGCDRASDPLSDRSRTAPVPPYNLNYLHGSRSESLKRFIG